MIRATSDTLRYQTRISDGEHAVLADATVDKGGQNSGFRPHDLIEAALASCVSMTVRMYADHKAIPLDEVTTTVRLDQSDPEAPTFRYDVEFTGPLTEEDRARLLRAAGACPVRKTLAKTLHFDFQSKP